MWARVDDPIHGVHIVPLDDLVEHDVDPVNDCQCGPVSEGEVSPDGSIEWQEVHQPLDGRTD